MLTGLLAKKDALAAEIAGAQAEHDSILERHETDGASPSDTELARMDELQTLVKQRKGHLKHVELAIDGHQESEQRKKEISREDAGSSKPDKADGGGDKPKPKNGGNVIVRKEDYSNLTYNGQNGNHWFRDKVMVAMKDPDSGLAVERMDAHMNEIERQTTTTLLKSTVPPLYLPEMVKEKRTKGRAFANFTGSMAMPPEGMNIIIPKEAQTATAGTQATENTEVSNRHVTVDDETIPVVTKAGHTELSIQSRERGYGGVVDSLVYGSLTRAVDQQIGDFILNDATSGLRAAIAAADAALRITYTEANPTFAKFFKAVSDAKAAIVTRNISTPNAVVMHPRRWEWLWSQLDGDDRPLVTGFQGAAVNPVSMAMGEARAMGLKGYLNGPDLAVIADHNMPTNVNTNQDPVILVDTMDTEFFEGPLQSIDLDQVDMKNLTVGFVAYCYVAYSAKLYGDCAAEITGTGLKAPA